MTNLTEVKTHALEVAAEQDRKGGPYYAEIIGKPSWHIVRTAPGLENKATDFLADRGIGVFLPKFVAGARRITQQRVEDLSDKLLFPGQVFVFVWDILAHWRRIMACPGVQSIMVNGAEKPVIVPDAQINRIQILQYELAIPRPKRRKRYASTEMRIKISTVSHWSV